MRLNRWTATIFVLALAAFVGASMDAQTQGQGQQVQTPPQGGGRGGPPQNVQVLPKDWTVQQVQAYMRTVAAALGVECSHCHVSSRDRASDAKPQKLIGRKMLQMVATVNNELLKGVGEPAPPGVAKVTCFTCHRGALKPLVAPPGGGY
jgi:hypothetical protein